jgi:multidrug resistance protein, MATE family
VIHRTELRETLHLGVPVVVTQLGTIAMTTVDTLFVGRLGAGPLSALGLGLGLSLTAVLIGMGTLMGLDPVVSQAHGAGRDADCGHAMRHGLLLALLVAIPIVAVLTQARWILSHLGQDPAVVAAAADFVRVQNYSTLPLLLFTALRLFLQGISRARPAMLVVLAANVLNVAGCWVFVFGHLGAPALGATGAAWATTLSGWAMLAGLSAYVFGNRSLQCFRVRVRHESFDARLLGRLFRLGAPVGTQYGMEVGVFAAAGVLMGWFGKVPLAAHQVALNLCSITYMVPFGLASTAAVRVGRALGRGDAPGARRAAVVTYALGATFVAGAALLFAAAPRALARLYTADGEVIEMAARLLLVGAAFQIFDASQTIGIGALRGAADTRVPMLVTIGAYWLVALPAGYLLAFRTGLGPPGMWWGLTLGLVVVAGTLAARFRIRVCADNLESLKAV